MTCWQSGPQPGYATNLPAVVLTDNVERVLTDIDANDRKSDIDLQGRAGSGVTFNNGTEVTAKPPDLQPITAAA